MVLLGTLSTWPEPAWPLHCGDGCAYIGEVNGADLLAEGDEAKIAAVVRALHDWEGEGAREALVHVYPAGKPAAHLFRCLHCGAYDAFADMT